MELKTEQNEEFCIPVGDCPFCNLKDVPLSQHRYEGYNKHTDEKLDFWIITCPHCDSVINWDEETYKNVKGWTSIAELEKAGWKSEENNDKRN